MMKTRLLIIFCAVVAMACDQNDSVNTSDSNTWILYERGYSPGAGYITEDVAAVPAQTISLNVDGTFQTSIDDLKKYKYYQVLEQGGDKNKILALYENWPMPPAPDPKTLSHSYEMIFDEEGNLKLHYRWCIEGCHLGFKKY